MHFGRRIFSTCFAVNNDARHVPRKNSTSGRTSNQGTTAAEASRLTTTPSGRPRSVVNTNGISTFKSKPSRGSCEGCWNANRTYRTGSPSWRIGVLRVSASRRTQQNYRLGQFGVKESNGGIDKKGLQASVLQPNEYAVLSGKMYNCKSGQKMSANGLSEIKTHKTEQEAEIVLFLEAEEGKRGHGREGFGLVSGGI